MKPSRLRVNEFDATFYFIITMYEWIRMHEFIISIRRVPNK